MDSECGCEQAMAERLDVSVVFATRNRCSQLTDTLNAYTRLDTSDVAWELVVVDNGSIDATPDVLMGMQARLPLSTIRVEQAGQNRARNEAIAQLRGRLIIFTDDDALPDAGCLQAYLAAAKRWPDDAIFGASITPRFPENTPGWMASDEFKFGTTAFARYHPGDREAPVGRHPYGPSFAVRADVIGDRRFPEHIGPQAGNYAMGGEGVFLRKLAQQGYRFVHVPGAMVEHVIRPEQVQADWLLRRANKKGRGQAYIPSSGRRKLLQVGGAPLRLWMAVLRSWLRLRLVPSGAERRRLERGINYHRRLGELQQRRLESRRGTARTG